jgi:hypothetical protein
MMPIAVKVMAVAPFGHSVAIQKSSAPIATKPRPALTSEGSKSGAAETAAASQPGRIGDESANPFSACEMPASTSAV